eukprot:4486201-Prymnesium_polylepis.1
MTLMFVRAVPAGPGARMPELRVGRVLRISYLTSRTCFFFVLGLPYKAAKYGCDFVYRKLCAKCPWVGDDDAPYAPQKDEEEPLSVDDVPTLRAKMLAYVEERAGEQGEDDKRRTQAAKQMALIVRQQEAAAKEQREANKQLKLE